MGCTVAYPYHELGTIDNILYFYYLFWLDIIIVRWLDLYSHVNPWGA